jgi:DNA polymerase III subunit epsilon
MNWFRRSRALAVDAARWVMLDVESSGLDPARDRLLAIAAVALRTEGEQLHIDLGDSFEVVLHQDAAPVDKANILLHGVGVGAQRSGVAAAVALKGFEDWVGGSPLIGWHVAFDERLIQRALRATLGRQLSNPWIDLADIAQVLRPEVKGKSLDDWLSALSVHCRVRHQAAADTLATAELLLKLWPQVRAQLRAKDASADWRVLQRLAAQRRWLQG